MPKRTRKFRNGLLKIYPFIIFICPGTTQNTNSTRLPTSNKAAIHFSNQGFQTINMSTSQVVDVAFVSLETPSFPSESNNLKEYWTKLPAELREIILNIVDNDYIFDFKNPYLRATYATVCREFQFVFERSNFRQIIVTREKLSHLEKYVIPRRQFYLEHLFLLVDLDEYDCTAVPGYHLVETKANRQK